MAPYAPAQVALLHSWDNGQYSPELDADDRYPTIEPSEDQYNGSYLSNVLPPLGPATSLSIRSPSHRHSWSCHSSDEHQQCCDSGAADSPQYRQVPYTDGDYVYSPEGYISSQHTPNDSVSLPTSSFRASPVDVRGDFFSSFSTSSPRMSRSPVQTLPHSRWTRRTRPSRCSTLEGDRWVVGRTASDPPLGLRAPCLTRSLRLIPTSPSRNHLRRRHPSRHRTNGAALCPKFNAPSHTTSRQDTRMPNPS